MYFSELLRNLDLYSIVILVQASRKLFQQLQNICRYTNVILVQTSRKHQILGTIIVCIWGNFSKTYQYRSMKHCDFAVNKSKLADFWTSLYCKFDAWLNFTPPWLVLQFMEYSRNIPWNIPYSKIFDILIVLQFFRNIPRIFHIPPNSIFFLFPFYLEYSIFQKLKNHLVEAKFWNIPYSIKCHK